MKQTDFDNKLINLNKKVTSDKTKHVEVDTSNFLDIRRYLIKGA